jgi:dihydroorotate dehydrogenase (fumarate)/dihydroorotate dehydrogenase (NAD+) catalytic subunit
MITAKSCSRLLKTKILGLELNNPILIASGPLTDTKYQISRAFDAGVGGIVTKTIYAGKRTKTSELTKNIDFGLLNSTTYSFRSLNEWIPDLIEYEESKLPIVVSIHAETPDMLGALAHKIANICSFPLELGISCPHDGENHLLTASTIENYIKAVQTKVDRKFSVKLSATQNLAHIVEAVISKNADAISLSDTLPGIQIDSNNLLITGGIAGYSGEGIKPIVQSAIYQIRKRRYTIPIFGIGGIKSTKDVLDYIRLGSTAIQIYSGIVKSGYSLISNIIEELEKFCQTNKVSAPLLVNSFYEK